VNARRFGMRTFDLALWAGPIAVLAVGLTIWRRYYARRFTGTDAPGGAPKVLLEAPPWRVRGRGRDGRKVSGARSPKR
jgi:hypothetical protein